MFAYQTLRDQLFRLPPETVHNLAETAMRVANHTPYALSLMADRYARVEEALSQQVWDLRFHNPIGMAAGFDKNGTMIRPLTALGFGFIEVGTVTPKPQSGNDKPRLWRHVDHKSLQNAMGFNNAGADALMKRIKRHHPFVIPVGVNVGKNKTTPPEEALEDYRRCVEAAKDHADYLVFNLSSPNTPGLRDLQSEAFIRALFEMATALTDRPVLVKIAPDMSPDEAIALSKTAIDAGAKGIIATNTTNDYSLIEGSQESGGGLSGAVLTEKSRALFEALSAVLHDQTVLISCGGITTPEEAYRRIRMGASLVQVYTHFIYEGPALCSQWQARLLELMQKDGFEHISEAIGADRR
jgi:dihydroorotate dehydrogenase